MLIVRRTEQEDLLRSTLFANALDPRTYRLVEVGDARALGCDCAGRVGVFRGHGDGEPAGKGGTTDPDRGTGAGSKASRESQAAGCVRDQTAGS